MSGVIDTNILLHAVNQDAPEHAAARRFLTAALKSREAYYLTEGIGYEFLRVATHHRVFPRPLTAAEALAFLRVLLRAGNVLLLGAQSAHWDILEAEARKLGDPRGNLFFDLRTVCLMREHGIRRVYSADRDFHPFNGLELVNPLARG